MAKDPTQGPISRYDEMNQPVSPRQPVGQRLMAAKDLRQELSGRTVGQLKQMAAKLEISGYSKMRKAKLIYVILKFYGFESAKAPISSHPPMTAEDLAESAPNGMSARVRRIQEASDQ